MKQFLKFLGTCLLTSIVFSIYAQVPLVIQTGPGGLYHKYALELQPEISKILGSTVVIEFKPGAQGLVGAQAVADRKTDIGLMIGAIQPEFKLDQINDIIPLIDLGVAPTVLISRNGLGATNLQDVIRHKSEITIGFANGSSQLFWIRDFAKKYNIKVIEVPYKTGTAVMPDIINETLDIGVVSAAAAAPLVDSGKFKVIATLSTHKSTLIPNSLTPHEQGISFERDNIGYANMMIWASPAMTQQQVKSFQREFVEWASTAEAKEIFKKLDLGESNHMDNPTRKIKSIVNNR